MGNRQAHLESGVIADAIGGYSEQADQSDEGKATMACGTELMMARETKAE
jgi:hypothetical protein